MGRLCSGLALACTNDAPADPQNKYSWGQRLGAGMVRMDTSSGKQKSSAYLTFRVMTEKQHGKWIIPAQPGRFIAKRVAEETGRMAAGAA